MLVHSSLVALLVVGSLGFAGPGEVCTALRLEGTNQGLKYTVNSLGDRIPDFSYCGYEASQQPIPIVDPQIVLMPSGADDTRRIQAALDSLASSVDRLLPSESDGQVWRGALVLAPGEYRISSTIYLWGAGLVLRGSGTSDQPSVIVATGTSRRPMIVVGADGYGPKRDRPNRILGNASGPRSAISGYAAIGTRKITVENADFWSVGDSVMVMHPSTADWIEAVGMNAFPTDDGRGSWLDWKPGSRDQIWHRTIVSVDGNTLELDAPLTSSLDPRLSQPVVIQTRSASLAGDPQHGEPNCHHLGVENLTLISQAQVQVNPLDEEHAWDGIRFSNSVDCWASHITCRQLAGSAIQVGRDCRRITVADCQSNSPISENAGWRRNTFYNTGQQVLFLRCRAEDGRHDFTVGPMTAGPNAFVSCTSDGSTQFSGPIGSWCTGVLYDDVHIDGAGLWLTNRETEEAGAGWSAVNCVLWNCVAPEIVCRSPPTGFNLASGIWGQVRGDGTWQSLDRFAVPQSLFRAQLEERVGQTLAMQVLQQRQFDSKESMVDRQAGGELAVEQSAELPSMDEGDPQGRLRLKNGWLVFEDRLAIGKRQTMTWWRGSILPSVAEQFGVGLTRFVPGCDQPFYTDVITEVADWMQQSGIVALEHHWGLWYDRRRDDHLMVRRSNGEAIPPFYELPWARSGRGTAWDGLSKYDLQRFNEWYFDRLQQFAQEACHRDLVLIQYMYFQHNVLESAAHWADFPWRPANCLQDTGFAEPPASQNRKRIFLANEFYDVSHPIRRELHERYIRHCLDSLSPYQNVIIALGEEFTGPVSFVEFWLDTIRDWMAESGRDVLVMLSACRDAQEAVLEQPDYCQMIDIVDVKYWWYCSQGQLYAPLSGQNMAPRQQLREWKSFKPSRSMGSLCRSIKEVRQRFPEKAVICSVPHDKLDMPGHSWEMLAAGASLPALPTSCDRQFLQDVVKLLPVDSKLDQALGDSQGLKFAVVRNSTASNDNRLESMLMESQVHEAQILNPLTGIAPAASGLGDSAADDEGDKTLYWVRTGDEKR